MFRAVNFGATKKMLVINNPTVNQIDTIVDGKKISIKAKTNGQEFDIAKESEAFIKNRFAARFPAVTFGNLAAGFKADKESQEEAKKEPQEEVKKEHEERSPAKHNNSKGK